MEHTGLRLRYCRNGFSFLENQLEVGRANCCLVRHQLKPSFSFRQIARACLNADVHKSSDRKSASSCTNFSFGLEAICSSSSQESWKEKHNIRDETGSISAEKLDEWLRDSVSEIVRHIGEAPFLIYIYSKKSVDTRLRREKAQTDSWPRITRTWEDGAPTPDAIILVDQLKNEQGQGHESQGMGVGQAGIGLWGVLIQGKGTDYPSCYILKTCRVCSSMGFCTHFCLVRANCFGETADWQLDRCWIL